jgi:hypothetical protein
MTQIKYYKVTCKGLNHPAYYAAYNLENVKEVFKNTREIFNFQEVSYTDIPATSIIHTAKLEYMDSRAVACSFESLNQ